MPIRMTAYSSTIASKFSSLFTCVLLLLLSCQAAADESDFPIPDSIRPAIGFWTKVYTEVDTEHGYLHDSEDLTVIYETLERNSRRIDERRKKIAEDLRVLASGKRSGLTESQERILRLWGGDVSNARLERAIDNIRWQLGQSDRYVEGLVRSGAYREHIERVARSKGLPVELAALPHVESSFHPGAMSSVAATGMWQFMRETAQRFMRVDVIVDERLDPYAATYAAMDFLKSNYEALGTWPLALTAYNHGTGGMARAARETGTKDIGEIISDYKGPRFGFASRNFYPQFIAALQVERNAEKYFGRISKDRAPDFAEYEMTGFVDVAIVAAELGVGIDELKRDNPALRDAIWTGNKRIPKGYRLKIDRASFGGDLLASMNGLPAGQIFSEQIPDLSYTVRSGDSLSGIASRYNTSVSELVAINQLRDRNRLSIGQKLILPQQNGSVPTLVVNETAQVAANGGDYTVRSGDTISGIANRYRIAPATLLALNNLSSRSVIHPGQKLRLKAEEAPRVAQATVASELDETLQNMNEEVAIANVVQDVALSAADAAAPAVAADSPEAIAATAAQVDATLAADPSDYSVASDNTIEILPDETLSHFADWVGMSSAELRRLNQLRQNAAVRLGDRLKLDFAKVDKARFESRRKEYHSGLQARYFASYRIRDTENYSIKRNEVLGKLAESRSVPMWLLRQYNPTMDVSSLKIGQVVVFPVVEKVAN